MKPLNPWLPSALAQARKRTEDADRVARADVLLARYLRHVHDLASRAAIAAPPPKVQRFQPEEGSPVLEFGWYDQASGWELWFSVRRHQGRQPHRCAEFIGVTTMSYLEPTDQQITEALNEYFEKWKREKHVD